MPTKEVFKAIVVWASYTASKDEQSSEYVVYLNAEDYADAQRRLTGYFNEKHKQNKATAKEEVTQYLSIRSIKRVPGSTVVLG